MSSGRNTLSFILVVSRGISLCVQAQRPGEKSFFDEEGVVVAAVVVVVVVVVVELAAVSLHSKNRGRGKGVPG